MDNIDRIITILLALVAKGEIAEGYQQQLAVTAEQLLESSELAETLQSNVEKFVNSILGEAIFELAGADDQVYALGGIIADAFGTGMTAGLAVGLIAAAEA